jgi:hypothetical protein
LSVRSRVRVIFGQWAPVRSAIARYTGSGCRRAR